MTDFPSILWATDAGELDLTSTVGEGFQWWLSKPGPEGLGMPKVAPWDSEASLTDGGVWSGARLESRQVMLPLAIDSAGFTGRQAARRQLAAALMPGGRPAEGRIVVRYSDGSTRELRKVRFSGGLDETDTGPGIVVVGLTFKAYDPLFYGPEQRVVFSAAEQPFFPGPPFILTPESVSDTLTVAIPGEVPVWPEWLIEGPLDSFSTTNGVATWGLPSPLAGGSAIRVRTDPRTVLRERVTDAATGANLWAAMIAGGFPTFYVFPPGTTSVGVQFDNATAATRVTLTWRPAYLTW